MKVKRLLILMIGLMAFALEAHDLKIALFDIRYEDGQMSCFVRVDRVEFFKALDNTVTNQSIQNYVADHFTMQFDEKKASLAVLDYELRPDFIEIEMEVSDYIVRPKQIKVMNTFLLDQMEEQENVVRFNLNDKTRSFRLNSERKETLVKY